MTGPTPRDILIAKRQRLVATVILGAIFLRVVAQGVGAYLDLPTRWVILADLAALGALAWALIVLVGVWRLRREKE
ncbi:MAG: DUF5337 family protein [Pseudomonadota bacterium]